MERKGEERGMGFVPRHRVVVVVVNLVVAHAGGHQIRGSDGTLKGET